MSQKTRVLNVRVVGFSAPEKQMLNSIFLLSVAPARQIGYKLWNSESGAAPDMYLLDGDSESAVASWRAAFSNAFERTLVVGAKNTDLGCTSAARPLGLKVVGAMDRLSIALQNVAKEAKEPAGLDASAPRAGTLPTRNEDTAATMPMKQPDPIARLATGMTSQQPTLSASMAAAISSGAPLSATLTANSSLSPGGTLPTSMTAAAPAATALPAVSVQPAIAPMFEKTLNEKPVMEKVVVERPLAEKSVDRMLSDKVGVERVFDRPEKPPTSLPPISGATPLSPSALAAAVAPSPRTKLHVVASPASMSASLPSAAAAAARIADAPMVPPPAAPVARIADAPMARSIPNAPAARSIADAPMNAPASFVVAPMAPTARSIADAPMNAPASFVVAPMAPTARSIADAPMNAPASFVAPVIPVMPVARVVDAPVARSFADAPMNVPVAAPPMVAPLAPAPVVAHIAPVAAPVAAPIAHIAPAPAPVVPPAPVARPVDMPPSTPAPRHEEQTFRVLTVDDSPLMRTFLQNKLAPYGINPEFAASGEEALYKISKQHFDLIFLDVMLPGMDGYDVCKMIKKNKDNNLMKVVMLTSKDKTFDKIRGTMAGCDGYLTKPVDEMKLRAIIERHTPTNPKK